MTDDAKRLEALTRLEAVMSALAEHQLTLSDEEIVADAELEGVDIPTEAARIRAMLLKVIHRGKP